MLRERERQRGSRGRRQLNEAWGCNHISIRWCISFSGREWKIRPLILVIYYILSFCPPYPAHAHNFALIYASFIIFCRFFSFVSCFFFAFGWTREKNVHNSRASLYRRFLIGKYFKTNSTLLNDVFHSQRSQGKLKGITFRRRWYDGDKEI